MIINLSSSSLSQFINTKSHISRFQFQLKNKTHFSKSLSFHSKNPFLHEKNKTPLSKRRNLRSFAIPGLDFGGNFESTQSVLEAVGVLTAIIVVHESGHFLAAYLQAASRDGLLPGDVILGVNGIDFAKNGPSLVSEVVDVIKKSPKRNVLLKIGRGEGSVDVRVTPDVNSDGTGRIGVQLSPNFKISKVQPKNILEAFSFTGREFWGLTYNVLDSLKQTFMNFSQTAGKVSGPVAIIAVGAEVAKSNVDGLYQFAAVLNINLAVINLLPLPALDGGTLALILVEAARGGKKLPLEVEQGIMSSGIMFVIIVGLFLLVRDTLNLDFIRDLL
ncbi:putative membrane metalloprotease ARASP2, chloroplastic [Capsicum annuum]